MKNKKNLLLGCGGALLVGVISLGALILLLKWKQPLAQRLSLPIESLSEAEQATATAYAEATLEAVDTVCGGPPVLLVLSVGTDSRADDYLYGLADVIRIVRADFVNEKVQALSLPRDLWLNVPSIEDHGIAAAKLSQVYFYGTEGMGYYGGSAYGSGLLAETLQANYGIRVDNYLTVNMRTFARMIDAVGGITIYVPYDIDGRYDPVTESGQPLPELEKTPENGFFKAGNHIMDGNLALVYARIRAADNDFQRQQRQVQVIKALRERLLSPDIVGAVPELIQAFQGAVLTDLTPEQITQLSCLGLKLSEEDIEFISIPEHLFRAGFNDQGQWVLRVDQNLLSDGLMTFVGEGTWPELTE